MRPHRRRPTRLPHPWHSPGKNTGAGCHFLLQCMKVKSESEVAQSCPTLSDPMDCSPPGSSDHGIFQARVLEWGAILAFLYFLPFGCFSPMFVSLFCFCCCILPLAPCFLFLFLILRVWLWSIESFLSDSASLAWGVGCWVYIWKQLPPHWGFPDITSKEPAYQCR